MPAEAADPAGAHVQAAVARYLEVWPDERLRLAPLLARLEAPREIYGRHRMDGHVTGSAFVVDPAAGKVLLIHHRRLDRWLQPGGHVDPGETPVVGAGREAREETGIAEVMPAPWRGEPDLPMDIDPHRIPASEKRGESEHWHFDLRYLFTGDSRAPLSAQIAEVHDVRWVPLAELLAGDSGNAVAGRKIEAWLKALS